MSTQRNCWSIPIQVISGHNYPVGLVAWILRGGTLLASLLASMPSWRNFDPIPILDMNKKEQKNWARRIHEGHTMDAREHHGRDAVVHFVGHA